MFTLAVHEFDLFECLMCHPRKALTHAQLTQHAWGQDYYDDEILLMYVYTIDVRI